VVYSLGQIYFVNAAFLPAQSAYSRRISERRVHSLADQVKRRRRRSMHSMNIMHQHSVGPLLFYYGAVVSVIVNGQPTTDGDIYGDEIAQLRVQVGWLVATVARLKTELSAVSANNRPTDADAS